MAQSPRILVTHPGRQHSHQTALALHRAGMLAGYWSGVPAVAGQARRVPPFLRRRLARYAPISLPIARSRWFPWAPALRRIGDAVLPPSGAAWSDFAACRLFDRWAATRLARATPAAPASAVIACEISALSTFQAAKRLGMVTILDAPSIHHAAQDRLHGTTDSPRLHHWITEVKDQEIALADHILTVSELARQTYLDAGVPAEKVHALALGADTELFAPAPEERPAADGFVFLFAGATIHRKGFDLLLEAFERVRAEEPRTGLRVVGPRGDLGHLLDGRAGISAAGPIDQQGLAEEFRRADCLVLPSRNDSYAMVVAEALSSGLPVIVSEMVGAKDLVTEGKNGWVVPVADVQVLANRMRWCARNPEVVRSMREDCRRAAEAATWPAYHRRLAELVRSLLPKSA